MWREKKHRIEHRIVSLSQVSADYGSLHRLSWDAYHEGGDLIGQVESYRQQHGQYPESVHADQIYRTQANRKWCPKRGIRLSGPPLGRPRRPTEENAEELATAKAQARQDELVRIPVEGKFGNAKRDGTLARVMVKLLHTSVSVINVGLIVLNLNTRLQQLLLALQKPLLQVCRRHLGLDRPTNPAAIAF